MKVFRQFLVIFLIFGTYSVLSQKPTCGVFDFNDPSTLNDFQDCTALPEAQSFLTTDKSVNHDITQCLSTKALFRGNFGSFSFQVGINLQNNNHTDAYNNVQLFVSNTLAFQIIPNTDSWTLYEKNFTSVEYGTFDDAPIGLKVRIGNHSNVAIEFIKFYDPQLTTIDCVPLYTSPPETTETEAPETEAPETEAPETEAPETEAPETEAPETETPETETPETETTEIPTDYPEREDPICFEIDFSEFTLLPNAFRECNEKYLPELIIKPYVNSSITPYRETSSSYLSNKWEGMSCIETTSFFFLPESSFIESAIFLNGVWPGAWLEISVVDVLTGDREIVKKLETENNWIRLFEEVKGKFTKAQIVITTNMNTYSQLAVEYINIRSDSC